MPCHEAVREGPDPSIISAVHLRDKRGLVPSGPKEAPLVDKWGRPLPVSWRGEADQPGGPKDPVRLLQMRPCYLLGRLLYDGRPQRLLELLDEPDESQGVAAPAEQGTAAGPSH